TVLGLYSDKVLTVLKDDKYIKIKAEAMIIATGASEKFLAFENNDLPGIYGAGAVQTLMNVYGVKPGSRLLMVGSGNIGLIVSYQLMQAGVEVALVIDAAPKIGGYKVHAAKLRRLGVAIKTSYTIKKALGFDRVEGARIIQLDENWNEIIGTEEEIMVDGICIAVGLSPLGSLAAMVGVQMVYIPELGGLVPKRKSGFQTSIPWIYVCGDASGIEEASSAMVEGSLAGLEAASFLGYRHREYQELETSFIEELNALRSGPYGNKYRQGLKKMEETDD
ncbi:MAG: FAD-dependent oxidoreductase, partial [Bacilli bacterium]|nr:FAD-dependent oxidoreductase [Bacilli bacterium]